MSHGISRAVCRRVASLLLRAYAADQPELLPRPDQTPGDTNPVLTQAKICSKGFTTKKYRKVSTALKRKVYATYGVKDHKPPCASKEGFEVDHLISLEIGGANTLKNLWTQCYTAPEWNAHVKDKLEKPIAQRGLQWRHGPQGSAGLHIEGLDCLL